MLQELGDHITNFLARAAEAERRAAESSNDAIRVEHETMARNWRHLAGSYQFVESLERFLLDSRARRAQKPSESPPLRHQPGRAPLARCRLPQQRSQKPTYREVRLGPILLQKSNLVWRAISTGFG
jgi:hypothetical protein